MSDQPITQEQLQEWRRVTEAIAGRDPLDAEGISSDILTDGDWVVFVLRACEAMPALLDEVQRLQVQLGDALDVLERMAEVDAAIDAVVGGGTVVSAVIKHVREQLKARGTETGR